jgi:transcriptional regulator with XRE-family HTH domain
MSQRQLAELLDIQPAVLSRRLNGTGGWRTFTTTEVDRIAEVLGVPVDRFLTVPASATAGAA